MHKVSPPCHSLPLPLGFGVSPRRPRQCGSRWGALLLALSPAVSGRGVKGKVLRETTALLARSVPPQSPQTGWAHGDSMAGRPSGGCSTRQLAGTLRGSCTDLLSPHGAWSPACGSLSNCYAASVTSLFSLPLTATRSTPRTGNRSPGTARSQNRKKNKIPKTS